MGTSRSTEKGPWVGGAFVFSGRREPTWHVNASISKKLKGVWDSLEPWKGAVPSTPPLGYRGCFLESSNGSEWFAYKGLVTLRVGRRRESRRDAEGEFESLLLSSAPSGVIPASFTEAG